MTRTLAILLVVVAASCGGSTPTEEPAPAPLPTDQPEATEPESSPATGRCLPVVGGCGCAYTCGWSGEAAIGEAVTIETTEDPAPIEATLERWCEPEGACRDAFMLPTICGGECIPTRAFDGCHFEGDRCVP